MTEHREVRVRGTPNTVTGTIEAIRQLLDDGWVCDDDYGDPKEQDRILWFKCNARPDRSAARLSLYRGDPSSLTLLNILPIGGTSLSREECNKLVLSFFRSYIEPAAMRAGSTAKITPEDVMMTDFVTGHVKDKLLAFSQLANKTVPSHPCDQERWREFVIAAHRAGSDLRPDTLARLLEADEGWAHDTAYELAVRYECGRELLRHYDQERAGDGPTK